HRLVMIEGGPPEKFGQLAGGVTAEQIHLKKTILGMDEAERPGDIGTGAAAEGGHAQSVAFHRDGRGQAGHPRIAVKLRQAGAQLEIKPDAGSGRAEHEQAEHAGQEAETFDNFRVHSPRAARMSATKFSAGAATSRTRASRGGSSAANCDWSMASLIKWPRRWARRRCRRSKSPRK